MITSVVENTKYSEATASPLHFARFEFKYILSAAKRQAVETDLLYFLEYDPFVANRPDHKYFVRSLYFDDPAYSSFHDKIDGLMSRYKFRVRTYSSSPEVNVPVFLEIKGRHNNLVFKHRTPIVREDAQGEVLTDVFQPDQILSHAQDGSVRDQFEYDFYRRHLKPVALIDYHRRPYISKYDPGFRITFDEKLQATQSNRLYPLQTYAPRRVIAGYSVVEVKFRHHLPSWFHQVIQAHELQRISISKIVAGMERLGLAHDEH